MTNFRKIRIIKLELDDQKSIRRQKRQPTGDRKQMLGESEGCEHGVPALALPRGLQTRALISATLELVGVCLFVL